MKQDERQALVDDRLDAFGLFVHSHVFCASAVKSTHTPILTATDSLLAPVHIPTDLYPFSITQDVLHIFP